MVVRIDDAGINYALLEKKPAAYVQAVALGIVCMCFVSLALVPKIGAAGAAWASVVGYTAVGAVFLARYRQAFALILRRFWLAAAAGLCLVPVYRQLPLMTHPISSCILTSLAYLAVLAGLRVVRFQDVSRLVDAFRHQRTIGG